MKPSLFSEETVQVVESVMTCKLYIRLRYIRLRLREKSVEEQFQWILIHVQKISAYIWNKSILEDLETEEFEFESAENFLAELKREFGGNNELAKIAELKQVEQDSRIIEEFIQKSSKREQIQRMSVN